MSAAAPSRARAAAGVVLTDVVAAGAYYAAYPMVAWMLDNPGLINLLPFLLSQGLLLFAAIKIRTMGTRAPGPDSMAYMTLKMFVSVWSLILPFLTLTVLATVAGFMSERQPVPAGVIAIVVVSAIYPFYTTWSVTFSPTDTHRWGEEKQARRVEMLNTIAVNVYVILIAAYLDQHDGGIDSMGAAVAAYSLASVPRFTLLAFRYNGIVLLSTIGAVVIRVLESVYG